MSKVRLSVVIPCYNMGQFLPAAIASVERCPTESQELIIVNDGSTDAVTLEVIHNLELKGYNILNQVNQGLATARNNGIAACRGEYILPLDADNMIRPDYIRKGIAVLDKHPDVGVVYGNPAYFGNGTRSWVVHDFDLAQLLIGNYIDACAVLRKQVWSECGGYDANMPYSGYEDWDLWLSAAEKGWQFHHLDEVLYDYRVRMDSMITKTTHPENRERLNEYICRKHARLLFSEYRRGHTKLQTALNTIKRIYDLPPVKLYRSAKQIIQRMNQFLGRNH